MLLLKPFGEQEPPVLLVLTSYNKCCTFLHHNLASVSLYCMRVSRPKFGSVTEWVTKTTEFSPLIPQGLGSVALKAERGDQAANDDSLPVTFPKVAERQQLCWE